MRFFVMRHGPAEDQSVSGRDADRALSSRGRHRVEVMGRILLDVEKKIGRIVTSPLARAKETAELVRKEAVNRGGAPPLFVRGELAMGGRSFPLVEELGREDVPTLLVGHQPDLSDLVSDMTGVHVPMDKAMIAIVEWSPEEPHRGRLISVLDPSLQDS